MHSEGADRYKIRAGGITLLLFTGFTVFKIRS